MEPPYKRQRIRDPDLKQRRARNDSQLKSIFESIFDKYSKDFEGIGDEIDLRTGEIVVNNGHLLGINNETDTGQAYSSSDEGGDDFRREEQGIGDYDQDSNGGIAPADGSVISEPDSRSQARYVVDSIIESVECDPPSLSFGESLDGQIADYNSEEDELADKTVEWVTPREARAIAYQKWQLPACGPTFRDESNVEEAWRVPTLPDSNPFDKDTSPNAVVAVSRLSPDPEPNSPMLPSRPGARHDAHRTIRVQVASADLPQKASPVDKINDSSTIGDDEGTAWTQKESDRLRHLKTTTELSYKDIEQFFPNRNRKSIATKFSSMANHDSNLKTFIRTRGRPVSSLTFDRINRYSASVRKDLSIECVDSERNIESTVNGPQIFPKVMTDSPDNSTCGLNHSEVRLKAGSLKEQSAEYSLKRQRRYLNGLKDDRVHAQDLDKSPPPILKEHPPASMGTRNNNSIQCSLPSDGDKHAQTSQPNSSFRKGAVNRKRKSIKDVDPACFEIMPPAANPLSHELAELTIESNTVVRPSHDAGAISPGANASKSEERKTAIPTTPLSTGAVNTTPAVEQQEKSLPQSIAVTTQQEIFRHTTTPRALRAIRRKYLVPGTSSEKKQLVQVVVQQRKLYKHSAIVAQPKSGLEDQSFEESPCNYGLKQRSVVQAELSESGHASSSRNGPILEIPDSQPATSSPPINENQNVDYTRTNGQPYSPTLPTASPSPLDPNYQALRNIMDDSELIDELSIAWQSSEEQSKNPTTPLMANATASPPWHKTRKTRTAKTANTASFPSIYTDLHDSSEDELSFM